VTTRTTLFCLPYAGGSALSVFRSWAQRLPDTIDLQPVELPGRGSRMREPVINRLESLIEDVLATMRRQTGGPCALYGHSLGALLAFECVRRLHRDGDFEVVELFVSGHRAPHLPRTVPPMHELPRAMFIDRLRDYDATPEAVLQNTELMDLYEPILRADFTVSERYAFADGGSLGCPIVVFGGRDDPHADLAALYAWERHTTARCSVRVYPGGHFFINQFEGDIIKVLAKELADRANGRRGGWQK
jgi:medium-chain acyl-[acyl-carrier-protein] hydrolase